MKWAYATNKFHSDISLKSAEVYSESNQTSLMKLSWKNALAFALSRQLHQSNFLCRYYSYVIANSHHLWVHFISLLTFAFSFTFFQNPCQTSKMELFEWLFNGGSIFSQKAPSEMFDRVLNTPLQTFKERKKHAENLQFSKCCQIKRQNLLVFFN